ncbi:MAG: cytochrome c oxidase subunit II [Acidobacteria bacterium]|nr:cytochrome c oxidase subunit II [Acidobacteriota bacterium]
MFVWLPEVASTYGPRIDHLFYIILYLTGGSFILTEAVLFYFSFKYRHREGRRSFYTHGNSTVEVVWTVVPAVVLVVLTFMSKTVWDEVRHTWPDSDVNLLVTASQFTWEVRYPGADGKFETSDDVVLTNEMHVPVGKPVRLQLRSKDVLHSFFLPNMRVKQDAVPGLTIPIWFEATKTGDFEIACAELCGFGHYTMHGALTVHPADEYKTWLEEAQKSAVPSEQAAPSDGPA